MLSKCANPECSAPFQYLHQGKLFELQTAPINSDVTAPKPPQKVERYWLCSRCTSTMTLAVNRDNQVRVIRLRKPALSATA